MSHLLPGRICRHCTVSLLTTPEYSSFAKYDKSHCLKIPAKKKEKILVGQQGRFQ